VTGRAAGRVLGLPLDRLFSLYLLICLPALAFAGRPPAWPFIAGAHLLIVALMWPLPQMQRVATDAAPRTQRIVRGIADWAPLLLIPPLYKELAVLNRSVHGGTYFDGLVIDWEQALFGGQPSRDWAAAAPQTWLSEPLHFAYLSYYFIIFLPPLLLYMRGRRTEFRAGLFVLMMAFFAHYVFFIYFPVQGPRYLFPPPSGELANGFFFQLAHRVLEAGSAQGAAFPSSHVGVSVVQTMVVWRYLPRLAPIFALLTLGLALGAIYGGFHYATDAIAGALLGVGVFFGAERLHRRLAQRSRAHAARA
jgi:membrane-associated phospholipid phosphatase